MTQALRKVHPFQEGFDAYDHRVPFKTFSNVSHLCPYQEGSHDANDWYSGWWEASCALDYSKGVIS